MNETIFADELTIRKDNMRIKILVLLLLIFVMPSLLDARMAESWTYQEMFDKANLVVIATHIASNPIEEHTLVLRNIKVRGVLSTFRSLLVLKGPKDMSTFQLHHYQLESPQDEYIQDGPQLIRFRSLQPPFLLFLVKEGATTYAPFGGQTDPANLSVLELDGSAL